MNQGKPVFLKTYGKQYRKLDAWISPTNQKQLFDSTTSSVSDDSISESKVAKTNLRGVRPAKSKAMECLKVKDKDEDNVFTTPPLHPTQKNNKPIRSGRVLRRKGQRVQVLMTSESEADSSSENTAPKRRKLPARGKKSSVVAPPPLDRFVTHRRGASKPSTANALMPLHSLDSSDDFHPGRGVFGVRRIRRPPRRKAAPLVLISSAENSVIEAGNSNSTTNPVLRATSLIEPADHSLGPCPTKPLFCSTPSARPLGKRPHLKTHPTKHQPSTSPSVSVSAIVCLNTSQEELGSPGDPFSPPASAPLRELSSGEKQLLTLGEPQKKPGEGESVDPVVVRNRSRRSSCSVGHNNQNEGTEIQNGHSEVPSQELFSLVCTDLPSNSKTGEETEGSSCFAYAAGGLEWLVEGLKEKCLTQQCTVKLEKLTASQLHGQTTYFSCLELTCSVHSHCADHTQSAGLSTEERAPSLTKKVLTVQLTKITLSEPTQQLKETTLPSSPHDLSSASDGQSVNGTWSGSESESDPAANPDRPNGLGSSRNIEDKKGSLSASEHKTTTEAKETVRIPGDVLPKGKKASLAPKGKRRRSVSRDRPGTTRKACVSGLSVSRWKDKGNSSTHKFQSRAALRGGSKDCSITELLSNHHNEPKVRMDSLLQDSAVIFFTPVRGGRHNLSSLLADITPSKHTWSRLKAALSIHHKTTVSVTRKRLPPSLLDSPGGAGLIDVSQDLFATPIPKSLSRRLRSQLLQSTPLSVCEDDDDLSDAEKVYAECGQEGPLSWEECILPQQMKRCKKIGEGTFGEVFSTTNASGDTVALKIIPVEGGEKVNGEDQKNFGEILHEIIISKELSSLKDKQHNQTHGFIGLNDLHCARGCYPPALLKAWDAFDRQKCSENDRPDFFEEDQLFLILEFEFGGSDLENSNGMLASLMVAKTILHQVTAALAVAEQELCFEHRDLHWGNVLVKTTREKKASFLLDGSNHSLETKGVLVRIIDYSLSRLEIDGLTVSCDISEDEELFMGEGDYQFDIYRIMRQENGNNWADYQPHSNVLWLHYLSSKLLCMKYRGTGGRGVKDVRKELTCFHDNVLQYRSAREVLQNALLFKRIV